MVKEKKFKFYSLAGWIKKKEHLFPIGSYLKYFFHCPQQSASGKIVGRGIDLNFSGNYLKKEIFDGEFKQKNQEYFLEKLKIKNENHYVGKNIEFFISEIEEFPKELLPA